MSSSVLPLSRLPAVGGGSRPWQRLEVEGQNWLLATLGAAGWRGGSCLRCDSGGEEDLPAQRSLSVSCLGRIWRFWWSLFGIFSHLVICVKLSQASRGGAAAGAPRSVPAVNPALPGLSLPSCGGWIVALGGPDAVLSCARLSCWAQPGWACWAVCPGGWRDLAEAGLMLLPTRGC